MIKTITAADLHALAAKAAQAPRLRAHLNVHERLDAAVQRLFIATEPGTYMRPHRHAEAHKWEFFVVLHGQLDLLIFDDAGRVTQRTVMAPAGVAAGTPAVEIPPNTWRKLPRQVDSSEVEFFAATTCSRYSVGGRLPNASCGRSSL